MKIRILDKGFQTTHFGYFKAGTEVTCSDGFADYCVTKMKAAEYVKQEKPQKTSSKKQAKK